MMLLESQVADALKAKEAAFAQAATRNEAVVKRILDLEVAIACAKTGVQVNQLGAMEGTGEYEDQLAAIAEAQGEVRVGVRQGDGQSELEPHHIHG